MSNYSELKRLAESVNQTYADLCERGGDQLAEAWNTAELAYDDAANPDVVLTLIAEIEQDEMHLRAFRSVAETAIAERDQLKAENASIKTELEHARRRLRIQKRLNDSAESIRKDAGGRP